MDWNSINFDWNHLKAFLVTANEGSLSAAARALNSTQPTIGRQINALEKSLQVILFERVGRGLALTPSGLDLLEHVKTMGDAATQFSLTASGHSQSIEGTVSITASEIYASYLLPQIIKVIQQQYPSIQITVIASNEEADLARHEADIAIRNFRPTQNELITKKIADIPAFLYATPEYLSSLKQPLTIHSLNQAHFIGFDRSEQMIEGLKTIGLTLNQANFPYITKNHLVHWEMTKQGIAIGIVPNHIGDKEGNVKRVLKNLEPISFPIWLTTHRELKTSRKIRLVFDLLSDEIKRLLLQQK